MLFFFFFFFFFGFSGVIFIPQTLLIVFFSFWREEGFYIQPIPPLLALNPAPSLLLVLKAQHSGAQPLLPEMYTDSVSPLRGSKV